MHSVKLSQLSFSSVVFVAVALEAFLNDPSRVLVNVTHRQLVVAGDPIEGPELNPGVKQLDHAVLGPVEVVLLEPALLLPLRAALAARLADVADAFRVEADEVLWLQVRSLVVLVAHALHVKDHGAVRALEQGKAEEDPIVFLRAFSLHSLLSELGEQTFKGRPALTCRFLEVDCSVPVTGVTHDASACPWQRDPAWHLLLCFA